MAKETKTTAAKTTASKTTTVKKAAPVDKEKKANVKATKTTKETKTTVESKTPVESSNSTYKQKYNNYGQGRFVKRKKFCKLCAKGIFHVDYKDVELISKYLTHNLKIAPRKQTGACAMHQRRGANAIKRARIVALIPYIKD